MAHHGMAGEPADSDVAAGGASAAPAEGARRRRRSRRREKSGGSFLKELPFILVAALALSLLLKTFLVQAFYIPSESMEQTLVRNDRVLVNKLEPRFGEIERGEIVVFRDPGGWLGPGFVQEEPASVGSTLRRGLEFVGLAPASDGDDLIKRVIGLPGDTVACCDAEGRVTVNDVPLEEENYLYPGNEPSSYTFEVTVPGDHLWVMGDHRAASQDSRANQAGPTQGFVPLDNVVGKAFVLMWPFDRFTTFDRPATFDQPALDAS